MSDMKEYKLHIGLSVWQHYFLVAQRISWVARNFCWCGLPQLSEATNSKEIHIIYIIQSFELLDLPRSQSPHIYLKRTSPLMLSATGLEKIAINEALIICLEFFVNQIFFFFGVRRRFIYIMEVYLDTCERCPNIETKRHSCEVSLYTKSFIHIYKIQKMDNQ